MPATKTQLTGGVFQDSEGNVLALGYLTMVLNQDGVVSSVGQVCSDISIRINLNSSGSVDTSTAQSVWANSDMLPINSYYKVTAYKANGQRAWGPNNQQVASGATFDVGTWIPNTVISWTPSLTTTELETNSVPNTVQGLLNFKNTATVTWVDDGDGSVEATAAAPATVELQTEGVDNSSQALLNLTAGDGVAITNPSGGDILITASPTLTFQKTRGFTAIPADSGNLLNGASLGIFYSGSNSNGFDIDAPTTTAPVTIKLTPTLGSYKVLAEDALAGTQTGSARTGTYPQTFAILGTWEARVAVTTLTDDIIFLGFSDNIQLNQFNTNDPNSNDCVFFMLDRVNSANWQIYCANGASSTVAGTGVASDTSYHTFKIVFSSGSATFYIDGVSVGTLSTNFPASNWMPGNMFYIFDQDAVDPATVNIQYSWWNTF